jgi:energy-coupling factor transport system substrate-specific component
LGVGLGLIPFLVLIVVASFMLGGREQVEAAEELMAVEEEKSRA